ncbi:MAG TPA: C39 family peptidase [Micromonospora sp.]
MTSTFPRWLPTVLKAPTRKFSLGIAGLALAGGAVAIPAVATVHDSPTQPIRAQIAQASVVNPLDSMTDKPAVKTVSHDHQLQPNFYYCGPAATRIALSATGTAPSQDELAEKLGTTTEGTNSAVEITRTLNEVRGGNHYKTVSMGEQVTPEKIDRLQADIVRALNEDRPVVANIAGTAYDTNGVARSFPGGHYLTVVGYRDHGRTVTIADPANPDGPVTYDMSTIDLAEWMATRGYSA